MLYRAMRPFLFGLDPEVAHRLSLVSLDTLQRLGLARLVAGTVPKLPVRTMGLEFPNPVGLAPGLDKNGEHIDALASLGFGFMEIGTVTPSPQPGNAKPRLFRLPQAEAVINRMGFNNIGVDRVVENVRRSRYRGIIGINISKNADTPVDRAAEDYLVCLRKVYPVASFVTANVSSPNTRNLRSLQGADELDALLAVLMRERDALAREEGRCVPLAVKIAPDLDDEAIESIADRLLAHRVDAVIATNTTTARQDVAHLPHGGEQGGLSGAPLRAKSTALIAKLGSALKGRIPIIGVGGIASAADAREKLDAGATLVQLYTALLYRGPGLVGEIVRGLAAPGEK
ncbi:MAG: dihydroorotate dehydrogenase (quinone) [Betaproteobacteria bacterium RBG_16_64_18]|nr:MAG: dihydroorotate dehydrogenase (quinone) [Betaproteobacteria bacterium RBG_16_64_18]OGA09114.1 MAG: dihydroorotate dehydrogenase (quinone) [Betaproteobacteria bacterium RIFCSPLOWO2_02_FULL_65_20]OGA42897.1 MAG: dihydroorotate dehydrogenase (quinone) [Betaproteobacteria bacterium RIFCSPLOWO2_12_FULL_65_110]